MSDGTELTTVDLGEEQIAIEQVAGVEALVYRSIVSGRDAPLWAVVWPSARALAAIVGSAPDLAARRVIEIGCGVGVLGIAAAKRGAEVVVSDLNAEAVELAVKNAARNAVRVEGRAFDWNAPPPDLGTFDGVLAADVLYADGMLAGVLRFIKRHLAKDGYAFVADPNRVMAGGVSGAARLHGLDAAALTIAAGPSLVGGVTIYQLTHRAPSRSA